MPGAHCSASTSNVTVHIHRRNHFSTASRILRRPVFVVSSFAASFPTKPIKRKNYLRPKILKTQKKPFIPELPSADPIISIDFPTRREEVKELEERDIQEFDKFENKELIESEKIEIQKLDKFENQELGEAEVLGSSGVIVDGNIGRFHKSTFLKYGLWLVGAFVFHTVSAAWIFLSADSDSKENDKDGYSRLDENGKNKLKVEPFLNGNGTVGFENDGVNSVVVVDEVEMERKIEEIQTMAREARAREKRELKNNGFDSEEKDDIDDKKIIKSGIEKEVDNRLIKLQKKLEKSHKKLPVSSVGILRTADERKNGVKKDKLGDKEGNEALMFKKKYKFKGLVNGLDEKPKGFTNSEYDTINKFEQNGSMEKGSDLLRSGNDNYDEGDSKGNDLIHLEEDVEKKGTLDVTMSSNSMNSIMKKSVEEKGMRKQGKKDVAKSKTKMKNGIVQDKSLKIPTVESMKSRKAEAESVKLRESAPSNKLLNGNYSLNRKEVGNAQAANNIEDTESESETDFWWLNLPYVLGILMHSGQDDEGRHGLYTLKSTSNAGDDLSHTVVFEDRGDANNFCYLLQSYFDELKGFGAEIVPLKVADLNEAVKSRTMRLVVVKKGQLRLYAGQPLGDAEMTLRTLVE